MMSNKERKVNEWSRGVSIIILDPDNKYFARGNLNLAQTKSKLISTQLNF